MRSWSFFGLCTLLLCVLGHSVQAPGVADTRHTLRELLRPAAGSERAVGTEPVGMYQRKTQAPVVWLNLHKTKLPASERLDYSEEAKQQLGMMGELLREP